MRKFVLAVVIAFAAVGGLSSAAQADCEGPQCWVQSGFNCVDPETCFCLIPSVMGSKPQLCLL